MLSSPAAGAALPPEVYAEGVCLKLCPTERDLLVSWKEWLLQQDPDGLVVFQVGVGGGLILPLPAILPSVLYTLLFIVSLERVHPAVHCFNALGLHAQVQYAL